MTDTAPDLSPLRQRVLGPLEVIAGPRMWWAKAFGWQVGWRDRTCDTLGIPGDPSRNDRPLHSERYQGTYGRPRQLIVRWGIHKVVVRRSRRLGPRYTVQNFDEDGKPVLTPEDWSRVLNRPRSCP